MIPFSDFEEPLDTAGPNDSAEGGAQAVDPRAKGHRESVDWRWWYPAIADWMLENPNGRIADCAAKLEHSPETIRLVVASNTFKDYFARRRKAFSEQHDFAISMKLQKIAAQSLDTLSQMIDRKRDQLPLDVVRDLAMQVVDRLGFSPSKGNGTSVNVQVNAPTQRDVIVPMTTSDLERARANVRRLEQERLKEPADGAAVRIGPHAASSPSLAGPSGPATIELEASRGRGDAGKAVENKWAVSHIWNDGGPKGGA